MRHLERSSSRWKEVAGGGDGPGSAENAPVQCEGPDRPPLPGTRGRRLHVTPTPAPRPGNASTVLFRGGVQWGCASVLSCVSVSRCAQPKQLGRASGPQPADAEDSPRAAGSPGLVQGRWLLLHTRSVQVPCALLTGEMCFPKMTR